MRLPQEAEWERAAFGMRPGAWPRAKQTAPVGTRPKDRSRAGVLDLGGNVSEWTADWYAKAYYKRSPEKQPRGPKSGRAHSVRGCHFRCPKGSRLRRATTRHYSATWDPTIGFRCARGRRGR